MDASDSTGTKDEDRTNEQLSSKVQRKLRLVKFEKTKKGNTVIHRQVDFSARSLAIPQHANYEELLQPVPPLIAVNNAEPIPSDAPSTLPRLSRRSSSSASNNIQKLRSNEKIDLIAPFQSYSVLSPVEEALNEPEMTASYLTKQSSTDGKETIIELHPVDLPSASLTASPVLQATLSISSAPSVLLPPDLSSSELSTPPNEERQTDNTTFKKVEQALPHPSLSASEDLPPVKKAQRSKKIKQSKKRKDRNIAVEPVEEESLAIPPTVNDESLSTQGFDIEQPSVEEGPDPVAIIPEIPVIYHKVGDRPKKKRKKTKKNQRPEPSRDRMKKKAAPLELPVLVPRKAVPFISATVNEQIQVEEDPPLGHRKKKRSRSGA